LMRRVPVGATRDVEVRVEIFNLLNTVQFGQPAGVRGSPSFGTITAAFDPRVVQLALKFHF